MTSVPSPGAVLSREIAEQPDAVRRQLHQGRARAEEIAKRVSHSGIRTVVIAARGSSDNAGRYAQYLFGSHNGLVVSLATPSLFTLYQTPPNLRDTLVIGISQSGQSPDIVSVLSEAQRQGALSLAVTSDEGSPLASAASMCLPLWSGDERAVAATKTYSCQLVALAMLSSALRGDAKDWSELERLPDAMAQTLTESKDIAGAAARFRYASHFVAIGRGFNYGTAMEISLKIQETSYVVAEPYSSADFRHGPSAMLDAALPLVLVAPSGKAFADVSALLDLCDERRADVVAISDREDVLSRSVAPLRLPAGLPEWLSPMIAVLPGQVFALELARAKALDPDHPRGLAKVTETW